jgi:hypothetical protein
MRTDAELLDACLDLLAVGNRGTLDALLDDDLYHPLGCGCCAYTPGVYYQLFDESGPPTDGFVKDNDYVVWRAEDGAWKEKEK